MKCDSMSPVVLGIGIYFILAGGVLAWWSWACRYSQRANTQVIESFNPIRLTNETIMGSWTETDDRMAFEAYLETH